ncbi:hypothetical protein [Paraburkholderia adhaesiva]|uniref:hypothetical protein n=1 Tax=Paraburkholderia adhaesiva TaxID=2883244 RepID=UPI001F37E39B|nr:hypothetical protein [Paraburkholderia adhaesiva]
MDERSCYRLTVGNYEIRPDPEPVDMGDEEVFGDAVVITWYGRRTAQKTILAARKYFYNELHAREEAMDRGLAYVYTRDPDLKI